MKSTIFDKGTFLCCRSMRLEYLLTCDMKIIRKLIMNRNGSMNVSEIKSRQTKGRKTFEKCLLMSQLSGTII